MATKIAKTSTIHGKRLQAVTIATTNLAMGTEAIGFENGVVFGVFVDVAMLYYRQSEKKPAKAPLTQKYGCGVAPMPACCTERGRAIGNASLLSGVPMPHKANAACR